MWGEFTLNIFKIFHHKRFRILVRPCDFLACNTILTENVNTWITPEEKGGHLLYTIMYETIAACLKGSCFSMVNQLPNDCPLWNFVCTVQRVLLAYIPERNIRRIIARRVFFTEDGAEEACEAVLRACNYFNRFWLPKWNASAERHKKPKIAWGEALVEEWLYKRNA